MCKWGHYGVLCKLFLGNQWSGVGLHCPSEGSFWLQRGGKDGRGMGVFRETQEEREVGLDQVTKGSMEAA